MKDIHFIFSNLARVTQTALKENDSEWLQYVASILKCLFSFNYSRLKLDEHLPHLPDHRTPNFGMEFAQYCSKLEWMDYVAGQVSHMTLWAWSVWGHVGGWVLAVYYELVM